MGRPTSANNATPQGSAAAAAKALRASKDEAKVLDRPDSMASMATTIDESPAPSPEPAAVRDILSLAELATAADKASAGDLTAAVADLSEALKQKLLGALAGSPPAAAATPSPVTLEDFAKLVCKSTGAEVAAAMQGVQAPQQKKLVTSSVSYYAGQVSTASDSDLKAALAAVKVSEREKMLAALGCGAPAQAPTTSEKPLAAYIGDMKSASSNEVGLALKGIAPGSREKLATALASCQAAPSSSLAAASPMTFYKALVTGLVKVASKAELTEVLGSMPKSSQTMVWDALAKLEA